ncbi:hypothetical protein [uncultured Clostridium sp.]|uniref:hypothetical protein n=1 Tax=uncultured Clostridium sp. TaxID=59620 RepID=UPI002604D081|nr:hypothetical protein [uncultured Clostridium sp.]
MKDSVIACRHLGRFFKISIDYDLEPIDFVIKALESNYKIGIEEYRGQWYSQSPYYYMEEFLEENYIRRVKYKEEDKEYEKERMYWLGYCLQDWSNRTILNGKDISEHWGREGIEQIYSHYKIYHTVDPLYVLEDSIDINDIKLDFEKILTNK